MATTPSQVRKAPRISSSDRNLLSCVGLFALPRIRRCVDASLLFSHLPFHLEVCKSCLHRLGDGTRTSSARLQTLTTSIVSTNILQKPPITTHPTLQAATQPLPKAPPIPQAPPKTLPWIDLSAFSPPIELPEDWTNEPSQLSIDDFQAEETAPYHIRESEQLDSLRIIVQSQRDHTWLAQGLRGGEASYYVYNELNDWLGKSAKKNAPLKWVVEHADLPTVLEIEELFLE